MEMTNAFSYPHWLIVAGAALLLLGFIGLAFRQKVAEPEVEEEMVAEDQRAPLESPIELALEPEEDRKAKLAQQAKTRWVSEENSSETARTERPKVANSE
jgi:hypothetical protein